MNGFSQAQAEYESRMFAPYDRGGAYFDEEEYLREKEDYLETQADYEIEERAIRQIEMDEAMLWGI